MASCGMVYISYIRYMDHKVNKINQKFCLTGIIKKELTGLKICKSNFKSPSPCKEVNARFTNLCFLV